MAIEITIEADADKRAKDFGDAADAIKDLSAALDVAAERFKSLIDESFEDSKTPDGKVWEPLADATLAIKDRENYSFKPLIRRGARGLQGQVFTEASKDTITMGAGPLVPYAPVHQFEATDYDEGNIPARPYLPVTGTNENPVLMEHAPRVKRIMDDLAEAIQAHLFPDG